MSGPAVLIVFSTAPADDWLRAVIRGTAPPDVVTSCVIVEGFAEADRIVRALAVLKHARHQPYGGAYFVRVDE